MEEWSALPHSDHWKLANQKLKDLSSRPLRKKKLQLSFERDNNALRILCKPAAQKKEVFPYLAVALLNFPSSSKCFILGQLY